MFHFSAKVLSRGTRSTVRAVVSCWIELTDIQTGETFTYKNKDVHSVELVLPKDAPEWGIEIQKQLIKEDRRTGVQALSEKAEAAEKRIDARVWREFEFSLHRELTHEQNISLAKEFVEDQICFKGDGRIAQFSL